MPDNNDLHVDPEALRASAKVFRALPPAIDAQKGKLYPIVLYPGEFGEGNDLKQIITDGIKNYETALSVLSRTYFGTADAMESAATLLTDADKSNDGFATQDIGGVGGRT
jgi:hypothetical protein